MRSIFYNLQSGPSRATTQILFLLYNLFKLRLKNAKKYLTNALFFVGHCDDDDIGNCGDGGDSGVEEDDDGDGDEGVAEDDGVKLYLMVFVKLKNCLIVEF